MKSGRSITLYVLLVLLLLLVACSTGGGGRPNPTPVKGITEPTDPDANPVVVTIGNWQTMPGLAKQISIGANGDVFVIGLDGVYKWNGTDNWVKQPDMPDAKRIAVEPDGTPWVVKNNNSIARLSGGTWQTIPAQAQTLAIGAKGDVYKNIKPGGVSRWTGTEWQAVPATNAAVAEFTDDTPIAAGPDSTLYVIVFGNSVQQLKKGANAWDSSLFGVGGDSISVGANGDIWVVGQGGINSREGNNWVQQTANFVGLSVAVDPKGIPWVVGTDQIIRRGVAAVPVAPPTVPNLTVEPSPTAPAAPQTVSRPTLNLLCKFSDIATEPRSATQLQAVFDGATGLTNYVLDMSYGASSIAPVRTPAWFTLPGRRADYIPGFAIGSDAQNFQQYNAMLTGTTAPLVAQDCTTLAEQSGINLPDFSNINLFINTDLSVPGTGIQVYGFAFTNTLERNGQTKNYSMTLYPARALNSPGLITHEMGHNFRDFQLLRGGHSQSLFDPLSNDVATGLDDNIGGFIGYNAYTRDLAGWIPPNLKYTYQGGAKQITLARLTNPGPTGFRVAQVPIGNTGTFYLIEARPRVGFDALPFRTFNTTLALPADSVAIHLVNPADGSFPDRQVLPPGVTSRTDAKAAWAAGMTMTDTTNNLQIRIDTLDQNGAKVTIAPLNP